MKWMGALLLQVLLVSLPLAAAEEVIRVQGPAGALEGTLLSAPDNTAPIVLIVPGSGPTNRDGNSPLGIQAAPYRLLAEGLAAHGVSSLRVDKRGLFGSRAAVPDPNRVTMQDYASDVRLWMGRLSQLDRTRCAWLLGHSEGGLVSLLAAQDGSGLCGVILIATPGRPLGQVLRSQLEQNPANKPLLPSAYNIIESLEQGRSVVDVPLSLQPLFRTEVQDYIMSGLKLDPQRLVSNLDLPVLIIQGGNDLQVETRDAQALKTAKPEAVLVIIPDANHVLKSIPGGDRDDNLKAYGDPSRPLADGIIEAISSMVHGL